jgi:hypothetical protein
LGCLGSSLATIGVERLANNTTGCGIWICIGIFCVVWSLIDILVIMSAVYCQLIELGGMALEVAVHSNLAGSWIITHHWINRKLSNGFRGICHRRVGIGTACARRAWGHVVRP